MIDRAVVLSVERRADAVALDDDMREFMSGFPTGVAVVSTRDQLGEPVGLTCSSLMSVALSPPTLVVCLRQNSGGTLSVLLDRGSFAVNLLHDGAAGTARLMARTTPGRFADVRWTPSPLLGVPWLDEDAHAHAECRVAGVVPRGDHTVVFGEVVGTAKREGDPLLYGYRQFSSWRDSEVRAEPRGR